MKYVQLDAAKAHRPSGSERAGLQRVLENASPPASTQRGKPLRRRTIEIEKQAAIILCQALEKIGDSYALYAFSGSGRAEVEISVIKDFHERLSQRIARRIDRIEPAHATRMGAAIRHAIRKLERVEAEQPVAILAQRRPALRSRLWPRRAMIKSMPCRTPARRCSKRSGAGIRPFCLTIDRDGEDYLRKMCDEIPYEVVTKVEELPIRLIAAYPS